MNTPEAAVRQVPVVIVGAGPTGVTAATLLAQYGVDCLVLDRWDGVYPQPRAVHMDDEVCRIVARLGVSDEFEAISRPALGLRLLDRERRVLAQFGRDPAASKHGFPQANMFDQPEFEAVLRANLARYPRVEVRGKSDVSAVTSVGPDAVLVTFTDRDTAAEHSVLATYVLGCDGANSVVRTAIGSTMKDLKFEQRWMVADVVTTTDLNQWDGVHQVCDPSRAATYMRIGPSRYRWEFQLLPGEQASAYATVPALRTLIDPWVGGASDADLELVRLAEYTFRAQLADRWRNRRIFLLGDAAHLTPPFIGQGMGAGLRDAMNLSWKLAAVLAGELPGDILDSYEQERKPHTRAMIGMALAVGWAMTAGGGTGDIVRRVLAPRLRLIPGMRNRLVNSSTPALRRSTMVSASRRPWRLEGTLCPNPALPDGRRVDAALGQCFAVITTKPLSVEQLREVRSKGAAVVVAEPRTALARWLRRGGVRGAIVRPDRTVMHAGRNIAALCHRVPSMRMADL
ncbi:bifunctional 3-(3-hydroxy-phenyl)propionate/3-hydroxycinnamic acid hydroxylase [Mycolicibacterium komossense]|uniref:Bifunctional 3-(3-hydroxy-phenyl)propionate/3-hydroxycinnamic acid hydroxylase n=1 Tax=Mycolicibacterium komossense TaxID=1779 RepID=A0ABT3CJ59_9MYCO|nr:bifunctional 3-(3-hydroxy-phenyl)propionate/3-hydroxycinnamic acid hydroxylase [Mycolicibacterium komossense]MCV7229487.1 bifunctional 3-(3-hydroxy-phenyl)propionate/3-hydroxycinnamic acid hydroxylase [Mycolicibacterium komossense]